MSLSFLWWALEDSSWICFTLGKFRSRTFGSSLLNFLATRISLRGNELLCNSCFRKLNTYANPLSCCARIKRAYVFCFKEILSFRKSTSHSARLRWTLHQEGFAFVGSQTQGTLSKTKTTIKVALFCNKKLPRLDSNQQPTG